MRIICTVFLEANNRLIFLIVGTNTTHANESMLGENQCSNINMACYTLQ